MKVYPINQARKAKRRGRESRLAGLRGQFSPIMLALPLAAGTAVFLWDGPPRGQAATLLSATDTESASFAPCGGPLRRTCVVDGDTFWYRGEKIRIADINTPETGEPECPREADLGQRATVRLTQLLNAGPFTLEPIARSADQYGRSLFVVTRGGSSLGEALVDEGLAERWKGYRGSWC